MKVLGRINGQQLVILIYSGSTHNFLDANLGKKAWVLLNRECRIRVKVTNGEEVLSEGKCSAVHLQPEKLTFKVDAYVIILAGCDMVLRIHWLVILGSIVWNFKTLTMKFTLANETFQLQGLVAPQLWEETHFPKSLLESKKVLMLHLLENVGDFVETELDATVSRVLGDFADIFAEPKGLPPSRTHDHAILLKSDAQLVFVQPYLLVFLLATFWIKQKHFWSSIFVPEWPKEEFVCIFIGHILDKTKTLYAMVEF
jgi:hypothetical protein